MTSSRLYRIGISLLVSVCAIVLMVYGGLATTYKIYEEIPEDTDDSFILFEKITDPSMVKECTISGVARAPSGVLYFTYDRSAPPKACPT